MAHAARPLPAPRNVDTILNFNDNDPSDPPFRYGAVSFQLLKTCVDEM